MFLMDTSEIYVQALQHLVNNTVGGLQAVARQAGISAANLDQVLKGVKHPSGRPRGLGPRVKEALLKTFPRWLETKNSFSLKESSKLGAKTLNGLDEGPRVRGLVPLISWVQAGSWCGAVDTFSPGDAETWLPCIAGHSEGAYALRVRGDSMTAPGGNSRTYPQGCVIFIDPLKKAPNNGDRVIAKLCGTDEVTFKIYKNEDGRQWLQPLNPSHEPIRDEFTVLGTVIGKWEDE